MKISLFLMVFIITTFLFSTSASATWWNTDYDYRKEITLVGNTSGAQTDYQMLLNVTYDSDMQIDFDDLRFTNDTYQIDAWLESKVDSSYALVWVEFPTTPADGIDQDYYMYYGNASVVSNWDIAATFVFGDDFSGDLSKWSFTDTQGVGGSVAIVSERLEIRSKTSNKHVGVSSLNFSNGILEVDIEGDPNINYQWVGVGFGDSETNQFLSHRIYANAQQARAEWNVGSGWQSAGTISATWTTWYAKNIMTGSMAKMYGKQSKGDSWTVFKEDLSYSSTVPIRLVSFDDNSGGVDGIGYFDNVRLRKYAINFPTYTFGSEDSKTTLPTITALQKIPESLILIKDKFFNIIPFIISIILFAGFGLAIMVMTSRLKKW